MLRTSSGRSLAERQPRESPVGEVETIDETVGGDDADDAEDNAPFWQLTGKTIRDRDREQGFIWAGLGNKLQA